MRRTLLVLAAAAAVAPLIPAPASAAPAASRVTVTVRAESGPARFAYLRCEPTGGTHRRAAEACATLTAAGGDPAAIPGADAMCTAEYAPVRAKLTGRWQGRVVRYQQTFSNPCVLGLHTGAVFSL